MKTVIMDTIEDCPCVECQRRSRRREVTNPPPAMHGDGVAPDGTLPPEQAHPRDLLDGVDHVR